MSRRTGWTLAVLAVAVALVVGLLAQLRHHPTASPVPGVAAGQDLTVLRERAALPACAADAPGAGPAALRQVSVECAADGEPVQVAGMFAGRPAVINLWAYWCGPCHDELPALAEYQRRAGPGVTVVTVHQDDNEAAALALLAELGVRLPTLQDPRRQIAAALRVPNVMPATVVLAADGSVARILPQPFATPEAIATAVEEAL